MDRSKYSFPVEIFDLLHIKTLSSTGIYRILFILRARYNIILTEK